MSALLHFQDTEICFNVLNYTGWGTGVEQRPLMEPMSTLRESDQWIRSIGGGITDRKSSKYLENACTSTIPSSKNTTDCPGDEHRPPWSEFNNYPPDQWYSHISRIINYTFMFNPLSRIVRSVCDWGTGWTRFLARQETNISFPKCPERQRGTHSLLSIKWVPGVKWMKCETVHSH
jgi:hypothetical protein